MAKVTIVVDTEAQTIEASIDGSIVANVKSASVYKYTDDSGNTMGIDAILTVREVGEGGVSKETNYYAAGTEEAKKLATADDVVYSKDVPGCVGLSQLSRLSRDIEKYLTTKR